MNKTSFFVFFYVKTIFRKKEPKKVCNLHYIAQLTALYP